MPPNTRACVGPDGCAERAYWGALGGAAISFRRDRDAWAERNVCRRKVSPGAPSRALPPHWMTLGRVSPLVCAYAIVSAVGVHQCADIDPAQRMLSQRVERSPTVSSGWLREQALLTLVPHSPWLPHPGPTALTCSVNSPGEKFMRPFRRGT